MSTIIKTKSAVKLSDDDSFKKIIIMRDDIKPYHDNNGFYIVGLMDFLLKPNLIEQL